MTEPNTPNANDPNGAEPRPISNWERMGFVLIACGMLVALTTAIELATWGAAAITTGFVLFVIGRFTKLGRKPPAD